MINRAESSSQRRFGRLDHGEIVAMPAFENDMTHSHHSDRSMANETAPTPPADEVAAEGDESDPTDGHLTIPTGPSV
jgi:hypothetical protein